MPQHAMRPPTASAQLSPPSEICVYAPAGASLSPDSLKPQQAIEASAFRAQLWKLEVASWTYLPEGALSWPNSSFPQQETVPLVVSAQE